MKAESTVMPITSHEIEVIGDIAHIRFFENVVKKEIEETSKYEYDEYCIAIPNRDDLAESIQTNYAEWLTHAKSEEAKKALNEVAISEDETLQYMLDLEFRLSTLEISGGM